MLIVLVCFTLGTVCYTTIDDWYRWAGMNMNLPSQTLENKSLCFLEYLDISGISFYFNFFSPFHLNKYTYHLLQKRKLDPLSMLKPTWQCLGVVIEKMRLFSMLIVERIPSNKSCVNGNY